MFEKGVYELEWLMVHGLYLYNAYLVKNYKHLIPMKIRNQAVKKNLYSHLDATGTNDLANH